MDKLRKDMEKSGGETVVLNTGLKDRAGSSNKMIDEEEEDEEDEYERFTEDEEIDEGEDDGDDEGVASFAL